MKIFLIIALRNLSRHKKRTAITLTAIMMGLGALVFMRAFILGTQIQMVKNISETSMGDAQIIPSALENIYNVNGFIENPKPLRKIIADESRLDVFSERVDTGGLVSSSTASIATFITGWDPIPEKKISPNQKIIRGREMTNEDGGTTMMGERMRKILKVEIGDEVTLTTQDYYGSMTGGTYKLIGTFETGNDQLDSTTVLILLSEAKELLSLDQQISRFVLKLKPDENLDEVARAIRKKITDPDLKVLTWEQLIPLFAQMIQFQNTITFVVMFIVLVVVAVGILNTMMMSILERIREFGLMMALGTKPNRIVLMVALESFLLTTIGAILGTLLGIILISFFKHSGIDLSHFASTFANLMIGSRVYPKIDWSYVGIFFSVVVGSNLLVSLYPAWRASRLEPIEAMRQV